MDEEEATYLDDPEQDVRSATHGYEFTDMARNINIFEMSDAFIGSFYFDDEGDFAGFRMVNPGSGKEFHDTALKAD